MSERDKNKILERRALFLGSALSLLMGCAPKAPATEPEPQVLSIPPTPEGRETSPEEPVEARPRNPVVDGDMPPLDVPSGVSERARQNYEWLAKRMANAHRILDEMSSSIPTCSMTGCESKWRELAEKHFSLDGAFGFGYACPGSSAEAKAYGERHEAHMKYYLERRTAVEASLRAKLDNAGAARYEQLRNEISAAHPRPCLSIACHDW